MTLAPDLGPLEAWLSATLGSRLRIVEARRLSGGAIQQNWLLRLAGDGPAEIVLRRDAAASVAESHGRAEEYALLRAAAAAGVTVPRPLGLCEGPDVIGGPFLVMAKVDGIGFGPRVVKDATLGGVRNVLARRLGGELARLHAITPPRADLGFLGTPPADPAAAEIARIRAALDGLGAERPALEWGLRWAELHPPRAHGVVLAHRDFRTGNYMLDARGLTAILDWEFAGWGDPMSDLGWFCAACWRFSRQDLEAGGIATRAAFYEGYEAAGGGAVDDAAVRWWELLAHLRWAAIALAQGWRHGSGVEPSLELALTGRLAAELELAVLRMTAPEGVATRKLAAEEPPARALHPEATGPALLDAALLATERDLLPTLSGHSRLTALMVASALRMAAREARRRGALLTAAPAAGLGPALRAGRHDGDAPAWPAACRCRAAHEPDATGNAHGAGTPRHRGDDAMMLSRRALLAAPALLCPLRLRAQTARPVRVVVGFPPGGGTDATARTLVRALTAATGQAFVVENRAGANGNLAMAAVATAPPDGQTLYFGNLGTLAISNALYRDLPFDTLRDFAAVSQVVAIALVVAIRADLPATNLAEFLALARSRPGSLSMGSGGNGSITHLAFELLRRQAGLDIQHVPYRGSAPALVDLAAGRIDLMIDTYGLLKPQAEAGRVRLLAWTSATRQAAAPDLPTAAESGLPGYDVTGWQGLVAPAATPAEAITRLDAAVAQEMAGSELPSALAAQGATPEYLGAAAFGARIRAERSRWSAIVRDARITPDCFDGHAAEPFPGLRGGHMPGARNLFYKDLLAPDASFLPRAVLRWRLLALGVDGARPVVTTCGAGVTACLLALAIAEAGLPEAAVYDGSWSEWGGREDTPVAISPREERT
ncbi:tripartite tricarboxylate transporter substrate-binding protein [Falsiroseomonas sp. HW251]|uniref:tripartite tricarboxylate transporter substrate-binding protein n=1 Tax=Falsiroseomonas sp. HW251 TaxID=3390998 RepID=UPI003D321CA6